MRDGTDALRGSWRVRGKAVGVLLEAARSGAFQWRIFGFRCSNFAANTIDLQARINLFKHVPLGSFTRSASRRIVRLERDRSRIISGGILLFAGLTFTALVSRGQDHAESEHDQAPKHYLTFQVSYFGSASLSRSDAYGKSETTIDVNDRFSGRVEVQPTEAYDLPQSANAQIAQAAAIQAAVLAGDTEKLKSATPPLLVTWFPRRDAVEITGSISETKTSSASGIEHGESRASSDHASETYRGQKVFAGNFVNAFVKIHPEEKSYDLQFTLMPDMASTWEVVHQALSSEHREEGHDSHTESEANVPLDMGPGQMNLGYSNYQIVAEAKGQPLAGEANELIGNTRIPVPKPAGWDGAWDIVLMVSWQIDIKLPPVELIITAPGYDEWRPEGNIKQPTKPGNKIVARATLKPMDGSPGNFVPKIKSIRFQLLDTSREPGVCMNWPLEAKDKDYDLRLVAMGGGKLSKSDQILEVTEPHKNDSGNYYAETQIDSYDFGGRASLRAVCLLNDGREIEGVMKDVGEMPKLPKMKKPGWIADNWRKAHHVEKLADDDDSEKIEGQKEKGDGFTLYEEYRGWVVNGKRVEGDPEGKDFFVLNLIGGDAETGIDLFEQLSELKVHSKLKRSEMSEKTRLMNGNRVDGPHNKDQHGVWVKQFVDDPKGMADGKTGVQKLGDKGAITKMEKSGVAGRPGITEGIGILARDNTESIFNQPFNLPTQDAIFAYDRAIAHELLHSVGVEHHGTGDFRMIVGYASTRNPLNKLGRPYYGTSVDKPIDLRTEEGEDVAQHDIPEYEKFRKFTDMMMQDRMLKEGADYIKRNGVGYSGYHTPQDYADFQIEIIIIFCFMHLDGVVGVEHGEHSGAEDCLMRYYFAKFYESKKPPAMGDKMYYVVKPGTERIGMEICRSGKGTGINAPKPPQLPQSRYGDAASDAGNCFEQICPNDAIPPRKTK